MSYDKKFKKIMVIAFKIFISLSITILMAGIILPKMFSAKNDILVILSFIGYISLIPFNIFLFYKEIKWLYYKILRRTK